MRKILILFMIMFLCMIASLAIASNPNGNNSNPDFVLCCDTASQIDAILISGFDFEYSLVATGNNIDGTNHSIIAYKINDTTLNRNNSAVISVGVTVSKWPSMTKDICI